MANNLSNQIKTTRVSNAVAAGSADEDTSSVDMLDYEGVRFEVAFGAIAGSAVTSIRAGQSADDSSFADLLGSDITVADTDDNKLFILDIWRPIDRFVRCTVKRATQNSTIDSVVAVQYGPRVSPPTNDSSTVGGQEIHTSPAEGTA